MSVALDAEALVAGLEDALSSASDADGRRLVSATIELEREADPAAIAAGSRLATDRWFSWEQPDEGFAIAGVGTALELISRGAERFRDVAEGCAVAMRNRVASEPDGLPAGAGPVWAAGFAFAANGGSESTWASLPPS